MEPSYACICYFSFGKGSFTNEVITLGGGGGGGGLEMMTSLYFPILFVKNFSLFDDMGGGGVKNSKFLMRSFVNGPLWVKYRFCINKWVMCTIFLRIWLCWWSCQISPLRNQTELFLLRKGSFSPSNEYI